MCGDRVRANVIIWLLVEGSIRIRVGVRFNIYSENKLNCQRWNNILSVSWKCQHFMTMRSLAWKILIAVNQLCCGWDRSQNHFLKVSDLIPIPSAKQIREAVVAQWIRPQPLNHEVPGSNLLAAAVVPLGKALYTHYLFPRKYLKPLVSWLLAYKQLAFSVAGQNKSNYGAFVFMWCLIIIIITLYL